MRSHFVRGLCVLGKGTEPLHILKYKQGRKWICHCLEYDLSGQSTSSQEAAFIEMKRVIEAFFDRTRFARSQKPHSASPELWQAWSTAASRTESSETAENGVRTM